MSLASVTLDGIPENLALGIALLPSLRGFAGGTTVVSLANGATVVPLTNETTPDAYGDSRSFIGRPTAAGFPVTFLLD